ncbi:hypothetical protein VSX64_23455 [Aurantimonas sp. C2-6-R+9]|uniref:hypothetical protein n=1 Tax=unclassified Aurantimonas TaxID=2638230 RepID=UPI002E187600|nr:hypothetical protein [Aurantimonas sp. C2-6-R+9]
MGIHETHAFFTSMRRQRLEEVIEIAIALLDAMDGDTDLEETGDLEPYLAWVGAGPGVCFTDDDREDDECDRGEPGEDDEPSLGWTDEEAERGTDYSPIASRLPLLDGEVCAGDEPEFEDEHGEPQEVTHCA